MLRGRKRPIQPQEREYGFHDQTCEGDSQEAADDRADDARDSAKRAALIRPSLMQPHGQHGKEEYQQEGQRASYTRLGYRAGEVE